MVATMGLSACSTNRALTSETGKNEVTMASRTPNWIFPISAKGYTQGENGQFIQAMYRPLFAYKSSSDTPYKINLDKSLGLVPEVSEDGKTYTITLRDDAKWSDGTPVSTRDIEFWWNLVTNNKDQWASYKEGFFPDGASLDIKDEHTFSITTTDTFNPSWFIDNQINKVALLPQHAWDQDRCRRGCLRPGPHPRGRPEGLRLPAGRGQEPVHLRHEPPVADGERPLEALLLHPRSGPRTGPQRELLGRGQAEDRQADLQVLHR